MVVSEVAGIEGKSGTKPFLGNGGEGGLIPHETRAFLKMSDTGTWLAIVLRQGVGCKGKGGRRT